MDPIKAAMANEYAEEAMITDQQRKAAVAKGAEDAIRDQGGDPHCSNYRAIYGLTTLRECGSCGKTGGPNCKYPEFQTGTSTAEVQKPCILAFIDTTRTLLLNVDTFNANKLPLGDYHASAMEALVKDYKADLSRLGIADLFDWSKI